MCIFPCIQLFSISSYVSPLHVYIFFAYSSSLCITAFSIYLSSFVIGRVLPFVIFRVNLSSTYLPSVYTSLPCILKGVVVGIHPITVFLLQFLCLFFIFVALYVLNDSLDGPFTRWARPTHSTNHRANGLRPK